MVRNMFSAVDSIIRLTSDLVKVGWFEPASVLAGVGQILQASFLGGVLLSSPVPSSARSNKSSPKVMPCVQFSSAMLLLGEVGGGSIFLILWNGGGNNMPWLAGGSHSEKVQSQFVWLWTFSVEYYPSSTYNPQYHFKLIALLSIPSVSQGQW